MQTVGQMSLSSGEAVFYVLNLGCAAESLVMNSWSGMQLELVNVDGQTRDRHGHTDCQRSNKKVRVEERETRGSEHEVLECNNEDVVGTDAAELWRDAWAGCDGGRLERGEEGMKLSREASVHCDAQHNSGYPSGRSLLVDLPAYVLGERSSWHWSSCA